MTEPSGPTWPVPFAIYDPESCSWRTSAASLPLASWDEPSPTWPASGTWDRGAAYARPMSAPPTAGCGASSSPLLKTPTSQLAVNGGSQHPGKRKAGGHGPTLADEVEHLLPTPTVAMATGGNAVGGGERGDELLLPGVAIAAARGRLLPTPRASDGTKGGPNQRGSSGDLMLPSAVQRLLPTPTAMDAHASGGSTAANVTLTDATVRTQMGTRPNPRHSGVTTPPPPIDGPPCSDEQHPLPLWPDATDSD